MTNLLAVIAPLLVVDALSPVLFAVLIYSVCSGQWAAPPLIVVKLFRALLAH